MFRICSGKLLKDAVALYLRLSMTAMAELNLQFCFGLPITCHQQVKAIPTGRIQGKSKYLFVVLHTDYIPGQML